MSSWFPELQLVNIHEFSMPRILPIVILILISCYVRPHVIRQRPYVIRKIKPLPTFTMLKQLYYTVQYTENLYSAKVQKISDVL